MVLVSDGADTTDASLTEALLGLKAAAVPVFTVGVGRDRLARDVQIDRVSTPRTALQGHVARDRRGRDADRLRRRDGDARRRGRRTHRRIAGSEAADGRRAGGGARAVHRGRRRAARVQVPHRAAQPASWSPQNNAREALIDVADRKREDPLLRRRAAARDEVHQPRRRRRQEPRGHHAPAHRRQQVHAVPRGRHPGAAGRRASRRPATSCSRIAA